MHCFSAVNFLSVRVPGDAYKRTMKMAQAVTLRKRRLLWWMELLPSWEGNSQPWTVSVPDTSWPFFPVSMIQALGQWLWRCPLLLTVSTMWAKSKSNSRLQTVSVCARDKCWVKQLCVWTSSVCTMDLTAPAQCSVLKECVHISLSILLLWRDWSEYQASALPKWALSLRGGAPALPSFH